MREMRKFLFLTVAAGASLIAVPSIAQDFDRERDRIFVTGVGKVEASPDVAIIVLGAQSRHPDWATANERSRTAAAGIRDEIEAAGVADEDVKTVRVGVSPIMDYRQDGMPRVVGYLSDIAVQAKVREMGKAGPLIDAAVKAGATNVSGPSFEMSDPESLEREARKLAMADARQRAEDLASVGGFEISGIVSVTDQGGGVSAPPQPMMMMARAEMAGAPATEISSGTTEVVSSVSVIYSIWSDDEGFRKGANADPDSEDQNP